MNNLRDRLYERLGRTLSFNVSEATDAALSVLTEQVEIAGLHREACEGKWGRVPLAGLVVLRCTICSAQARIPEPLLVELVEAKCRSKV